MITKEINVVVKETGLDEVNKKVDKLEMSVDSLEQQQRSLTKSMGASSQSVLDNGGAMGLLNDATGGVAMTIKDAVEASWLFTKSQKASSIATAISTTVVGASTGAMKAFRIALATTGVGLLVIGLGLLIANFDKVKQAVLNLVPGLAKVGEFFSGLIDAVTDFIGLTSEAERAFEELTKQADKSLAMNKKFIAEQGDILSEYTKKKIDAKNRYLEAIKEEGSNQEALAKRLNRELVAIDNERENDLAKVRKDAQDKADALMDECNKKAKEKRDKEQQDEIDRLKKLEDERIAIAMDSARKAVAILDELNKNNESPAEKEMREFEEKKAILEKNNIDTQELERQHQKALFEIYAEERAIRDEADWQYLEEERKRKEERIALENDVKNAKFDIANQTLSLISEIGGKGAKIAKALAITQATVSGIQGVQNAFTTASASPITTLFPAYPFIQAGLAGAFSALQIAKIAKGEKSGGGSGSGSGSGGGSAPQAPSFNLVQGTGTNQIAQSISSQQPIKAFVVAKDVTTGQSMDRNIIEGASL